MKLIIKDFISSLNEETGLNELIPKILLMKGYIIINTAQKGVRQDGVDILAEKRGEPYLITIKQGNINRTNWNTGPTALKQSLDDIIDTYITLHLPRRYESKKKHILVIFNGIVEQSLQNSITGYEKKNKSYDFLYWNIDKLTELTHECCFNENFLSPKEASLFRKNLAVINDCDFKTSIYLELINESFSRLTLCKNQTQTKREIAKIVLMQKILCEWDINLDVYLNKIKCCELLILRITSDLLSSSKMKKEYEKMYNSIIDIYLDILDKYYKNAFKINNTVRSIVSYDSIGQRAKLYEILGILSLYGIILIKKNDIIYENRILEIHNLIINIMNNYKSFNYIPFESNCCDISIILMFLVRFNDIVSAKNITISLLQFQGFNYKINSLYPYPNNDYYEAISSINKRTKDFKSTVVLENLYEWLFFIEGKNTETEQLIKNLNSIFKDVSFQLWFYSSEEEFDYFRGKIHIGTTIVMPKFNSIDKYCNVLINIFKKIKKNKYFVEQKNIQYVSFIASRHYRMPINPFFYLSYLIKKN